MFAQQGSKKGEHRLLFLFDQLVATPLGESIHIKRKDAGILRSDLPSAMYKLNQLLMKGLRMYHSGKTEDSRMRAALEDIEILFRKGLFIACRREINKIRIRATEKENHQILLQLTDWDLQLIRANPPVEPIQAMQKLNFHKQELVTRVKEKEEYLSMYRLVFMITKLRPTQMDANNRALLQDILHSPALQTEIPTFTLIASLTRLLIPGLYAMGQKNYEEALENFEQSKAIFERHNFLINQYPDIYRATLTGLLNACLYLGKVEKYKAILDRLPVIRMESRTDKRRLQVLVYSSSLLYCLNFGDKASGTRLIEEIQSWVANNLSEFETDVLFNFYYNSCLFHFMHGNYKQAILLLNQILNSKRQDLRQDIYDYAQLFQLLIHFELHNMDLLEYQIQNVRRYLKTRKLDREYEANILQFFVKALEMPQVNQLRKEMETLCAYLAGLLADTSTPPPLGCQEILMWLESKRAGKEIGEYYRLKLEQRRA